jgi:hypothetical protein
VLAELAIRYGLAEPFNQAGDYKPADPFGQADETDAGRLGPIGGPALTAPMMVPALV